MNGISFHDAAVGLRVFEEPWAVPDFDRVEAGEAGADDFAEDDGVAEGLGPRMNLDSCGGCHIQPALGGSSPHPLFGTPPLGNARTATSSHRA